ncbi:MAG: PhzF family phenazine biosynthesis protein [Rhodospirillaceae bacterium]|nr:PhzF family phenazine biosynthesis protein [Rhodospirillaceae bacterium]
MTQLRYAVVDVFAEAPLQGNPAAIVFDADALDGARMQAIAREFNLSETAFILKPKDAENTAHVRLFTPLTKCRSPAIPISAPPLRWRTIARCAVTNWCSKRGLAWSACGWSGLASASSEHP